MQRLQHSLSPTTAINRFNPTTLPNQDYHNQTEPSLLLQLVNCARSPSLALSIPAVIALISLSALESCKLEFVYIHVFHRPNFLKTVSWKSSIPNTVSSLSFRTIFELENPLVHLLLKYTLSRKGNFSPTKFL